MTSAFFIIECGVSSGLGHIRRSLVLADALRKKGVRCQFSLTSDIALPMVKQFGFKDILELVDIPADVDILIVDGNAFSKKQINQWGKASSLFCLIDDNGARPKKSDVIINPNLYAKSVSYEKYEADKFLLGPEYHLIAPDFFAASLRREIEYLISFGGTDNGRLAGPLIKHLQSRTDKKIVWAVPPHISPHADLLALADSSENFSLEIDASIPDVLAKAHCFIGGAGAMVSEAIASDCSVVTCAIVPDQDNNIEFLAALGLPAFSQFDVDLILKAALSYDKYPKPHMELKANGPDNIAAKLISWLEGR